MFNAQTSLKCVKEYMVDQSSGPRQIGSLFETVLIIRNKFPFGEKALLNVIVVLRFSGKIFLPHLT